MRCKAWSASTTRTHTWLSTLPRSPGSFTDEPLILPSPFIDAAGGDFADTRLQYRQRPAGASLPDRRLAGRRSVANPPAPRRPGADHPDPRRSRPGPKALVAWRKIVQ